MTSSIFECLSAAWPIAIKRFRNSSLVNGAPASYWQEDFFVSLAAKEPWAVILYEVSTTLSADSKKLHQLLSGPENENVPNASVTQPYSNLKTEEAETFIYVLAKLHKSHFSNEDEQAEFRSSLLIALEKFSPLDDEEAQLLLAAKETMACCDSAPLPKGAQYKIEELSGSGCTDYSKLIEQTLAALSEMESRKNQSQQTYDRYGTPQNTTTLNASDISIIRQACSNGRFEAAFNLAIAQNQCYDLLKGDASKWMTPIVNALKFPAAVEREYLRLKTRLISFDKCQQIYPNCMKLYSACFLLRSERKRKVEMIKTLSDRYRMLFEQDLKLLDDALQISKDDVLKTAFFLWLKKEYFNRIQDAKMEELEPWIQNHIEEVSLAIAHRSIQTKPNLKDSVAGLQNFAKTIDASGAEEKRLLYEARDLFSAVNREIEVDEKLTIATVTFAPASAINLANTRRPIRSGA